MTTLITSNKGSSFWNHIIGLGHAGNGRLLLGWFCFFCCCSFGGKGKSSMAALIASPNKKNKKTTKTTPQRALRGKKKTLFPPNQKTLLCLFFQFFVPQTIHFVFWGGLVERVELAGEKNNKLACFFVLANEKNSWEDKKIRKWVKWRPPETAVSPVYVCVCGRDLDLLIHLSQFNKKKKRKGKKESGFAMTLIIATWFTWVFAPLLILLFYFSFLLHPPLHRWLRWPSGGGQ